MVSIIQACVFIHRNLAGSPVVTVLARPAQGADLVDQWRKDGREVCNALRRVISLSLGLDNEIRKQEKSFVFNNLDSTSLSKAV